MSRHQCKAVKKFFFWLQSILRMEELTKEQRQAARKRAWRKNNHSGGENKASQHQKSDLDEPIRCKVPPGKDNEAEEMVLVPPEPAASHESENNHSGGENKASQHQKSNPNEPTRCKMPSKKHAEGERMVQVHPNPAASTEASQHQKSDRDEPVPCKMPSKRYDKGKKMVLVRPRAVSSHGREKMFLVRPKPVASPRTKDQ